MSFPTIEKYYDKTRFDYRYVWNSRNTQAIHFGFYDEFHTHHKAAVANMNRVLADLADIKGGEKVLDAGCGVGGSCIWLAQNRDCESVGVSLVASHLKDAQNNTEKADLTHKVQFIQADFCKIPLPDASFDVVWAIESQCHAIQKIDFYKEAFRLLKKGGRLVVADYFRVERPFPTLEDEELLKNWLIRWAIQDLDTEGEHRTSTEQVGFSNFKIQNINPHVRRSLLNAYEHSDKWHSTAKVLNKLGIVSSVQVGNAYGTICQFKAWEKGLWYYGLLSAEKL